MSFLALWPSGGSSQWGAETERQGKEGREGVYSLRPSLQAKVPLPARRPTPQPSLSPSLVTSPLAPLAPSGQGKVVEPRAI